jgi:hypothetical protein
MGVEMDNILGRLLGNERSVVVRVDTGSVESKVYCRESEVGKHLSDMMRLSAGSMSVTIDSY